tara:strand:- start:3740 stop:3907 length:168 start_codon:yes stop_codon:yes gene_type:complete
MPKKKAPVPTRKHEMRYADTLHKKLIAAAEREGLNNSEMLRKILRAYFYPKKAKG